MPRELSSFDDLATVFGGCKYLQNIFVERGIVFSPPFFGRGETTPRTRLDYCCVKAEIPHAASTTAIVAVGLKIIDGSVYARVVTVRDDSLPEQNAVIFTETNESWMMTVLVEKNAPEWFDHLAVTLKTTFGKASELPFLYTWTIPDIESALKVAIRALRERSGSKSKAN